MQNQIKFLMSRSVQPEKKEEDDDEEFEFFVALPSSLEEDSTVNVKPFDISKQKIQKRRI